MLWLVGNRWLKTDHSKICIDVRSLSGHVEANKGREKRVKSECLPPMSEGGIVLNRPFLMRPISHSAQVTLGTNASV